MGDIKAPKFTGTGYSGLKEYHRQMKQIIQDNDLDADVDIEEYDVSSDVDKEVTGISSDVDTDVDGEVKKGKGIFNLRDMLKYQREITSETSVGATISNGAVAFATGFLNQSKDEIDGLIFLLSLCTLPYTITEDINTPDDDINLTGLLAKKVMDISKIRSGDEFKNSYYENAAGYVNEKAASGFKDGEEGYKKIEQAGEFISSIVFIVSFGKIFGGQASTEAPTGITQKIFNSKNVAVAGATGLSALGEESVEDINSEDMTDADYIKSYFHTIVGGVIDSGISLVGGLIEQVFPLNEENPWVSMIKRAFSKGTVDALDVPLDALIDTMFNGKSYQENFENAGGFQSMMQRFLLSASGSAVDDSLSFKDYDTAVDSKAGKIDNIDDDFNTKTDGYLDDNYGGKVDSIDDFKGKTDVKLDDGKQPKDDVSSINSDEIEKYKNDNKKQEEKKKASSITAKDVMEAIKNYSYSFSSNSETDLYIYNYIILPVDQTYGDGCGYQMILDYIGGVVPPDDPYYVFLSSVSENELKNFAFNLSRYNYLVNGEYAFYIDDMDEMSSFDENSSNVNMGETVEISNPGPFGFMKKNQLKPQNISMDVISIMNEITRLIGNKPALIPNAIEAILIQEFSKNRNNGNLKMICEVGINYIKQSYGYTTLDAAEVVGDIYMKVLKNIGFDSYRDPDTGIIINFLKGLKSMPVTPKNVLADLKKLPKDLIKSVKKLNFYDTFNPYDFYWVKKQNRTDGGTPMTGGYGEINFWWNGYLDLYAVAHESAHCYDREMAKNWGVETESISDSKLWQDAIKSDYQSSGLYSVTDYGATAFVEDFAESVALFYTNPSALDAFPARKAILMKYMPRI